MATNQAVGGSNPSGRANIRQSYQAVRKLAADRCLFEYHQCRSIAELSSADAICRFKSSSNSGAEQCVVMSLLLKPSNAIPISNGACSTELTLERPGLLLQHRMNSPES